ncbi:hypothetical protein ACFLUG_01560 [Chloroflexota bacterium]
MVKDKEFQDIQKKVYMSYFKDGWWDILLGLFLVSWGVVFITDFTWLPTIVFITMFSITWPLKRLVTYPRIGYVKLTEEKKQVSKLLILGSGTFLLGLIAFFLFDGGSNTAWIDQYFMMLFAGMIAVIICFLAYWWKAVKWYLYAAILMASVSLHQWLDVPLAASFLVPGTIIVMVGIYYLVSFLRKYPKVTETPGITGEANRSGF